MRQIRAIFRLYGQHGPDPLSGVLVAGDQVGAQELDRRLLGDLRNEGRHAVEAGRIARRELPDLAHAREFPNVEGVEADQVAVALRLDVRPRQAHGACAPSAGRWSPRAPPAGSVAPNGSAHRAA